MKQRNPYNADLFISVYSSEVGRLRHSSVETRATQTRQGAAELHNGHPLDAMIWQDPAQLWNALKNHVRW